MKHANFIRFVPLLLLVGALGCKSFPTYFVKSDRLATKTPLSMDKAYVAPNAAELMTSKTLLIRFIDPRQTMNPEISKYKKRTDFFLLRNEGEKRMADELWRSRVFSDVGATSDTWPIKNPDLRLDMAITGWDEGNGLIRYLLPSFISPVFRLIGTGPTRVQVEGRMTDLHTGEVVLEFAEARMHPGGPQLGLFTLRPFRGNELAAEDVVATWIKLSEGIRDITGVKAAKRPRDAVHPYRSPYLKEPDPKEYQ